MTSTVSASMLTTRGAASLGFPVMALAIDDIG
jgi:hypothetical protein